MYNEQWFIVLFTALTGFVTYVAKSMWVSRGKRLKIRKNFHIGSHINDKFHQLPVQMNILSYK